MGRCALSWLLSLLVLGGVGCREETRHPSTSAPGSVDPSDPPIPTTEWVAVFEVGEVNDLEDETQDLKQAAGRHIAVSPIGCWIGLSKELGDPQGQGLYVAAVVARSEPELRSVIRAVGEETLFVGELPAVCTD